MNSKKTNVALKLCIFCLALTPLASFLAHAQAQPAQPAPLTAQAYADGVERLERRLKIIAIAQAMHASCLYGVASNQAYFVNTATVRPATGQVSAHATAVKACNDALTTSVIAK